MKTRFLVSASLLACCAMGVQAAPPHSITYAKKAEEPGKVLTINGNKFVIVRLPVRAFSGDKYAITFPAPLAEGDQFTYAILPTYHGTDGFTQNLTIDGYPAQVEVSDSRVYQLTQDFLEPGTNLFTVSAQATATVTINLGGTVLLLGESVNTKDPIGGGELETEVGIGNSFNAASAAESEWWKYTDPTTQVNTLDYWVDYIRIYKY